MRRCWADDDEATEYGACGVAIVFMKALTGFSVVQRSWKTTGFDYWLGHDNSPLFQGKARLEVSGIRRGDDSQISSRARIKLGQVARSASRIPAYVVIVEFSRPTARVAHT
jgi:hypothetical protein